MSDKASASVSSDSVEIALGFDSNTKNSLRRGVNGYVLATSIGSYLECNKGRSFWITWNETTIRVRTDSEVILQYSSNQLDMPVVNALGFSGAGTFNVRRE